MTQQTAIKLFDEKKVRIVWDDAEEKYYFSIVDVVNVLTEQSTPRGASTYWAVLKKRLNNIEKQFSVEIEEEYRKKHSEHKHKNSDKFQKKSANFIHKYFLLLPGHRIVKVKQ